MIAMCWKSSLVSSLRSGGFHADQPVSAARHSENVDWPPGFLAERFANCRNVDLNIAFFDDKPGPNLRHDLVFRDHFAARCGKRGEDVEGLALELYRGLAGPKLAVSEIEAEAPETDLSRSLGANHHHDSEQLSP
jgi:hypothetical protein